MKKTFEVLERLAGVKVSVLGPDVVDGMLALIVSEYFKHASGNVEYVGEPATYTTKVAPDYSNYTGVMSDWTIEENDHGKCRVRGTLSHYANNQSMVGREVVSGTVSGVQPVEGGVEFTTCGGKNKFFVEVDGASKETIVNKMSGMLKPNPYDRGNIAFFFKKNDTVKIMLRDVGVSENKISEAFEYGNNIVIVFEISELEFAPINKNRLTMFADKVVMNGNVIKNRYPQ